MKTAPRRPIAPQRLNPVFQLFVGITVANRKKNASGGRRGDQIMVKKRALVVIPDILYGAGNRGETNRGKKLPVGPVKLRPRLSNYR